MNSTVTSSPEAEMRVLPTWPRFEQDEIDAVANVLASGKVNYWTGEEGRSFETEIAKYVGTKHGIAIANGTVTLELALIALGIGPGDDVIITPRTFMATATAVMVRGARPIFADVDLDSGNITAETIERVWTPRTKAIIPVHLGGWPCEMEAMCDLATSKGASIIEDCAQAHGAKVSGRSVGSFGHINSWSFCQDKIMTLGGEGGAITTDDSDAWQTMWEYKDHGKSYDAVYNTKHAPGFRWVNHGVGTNWRLTEMQSAIGRIQLRKLDSWVNSRRENAGILTDLLSENPLIRIPEVPKHLYHAHYRWYGYLELDQLKPDWSRQRICDEVSGLGYWCQVGSCSEIYLERAFDTQYRPETRLANARELGETSLCLAVHPTLGHVDMMGMAEAVDSILKRARR